MEALLALQSPCHLCPRECGAMRAEGEAGYCGTASAAVVASWGAHYGEESVLVGSGGSGTIFLSGCNLKCVFCQNSDISHDVSGRKSTPADIAAIMLALEEKGCQNVNFVTPTHHAPQIAQAVKIARETDFALPVVYNCGGFESIEALSLLEGLVDIYMPDAKFLDSAASDEYLNTAKYPGRMRDAVLEMHRQVGDLEVKDGLAVSGLIVRHLVMPGHVRDSCDIMDFLAGEVSAGTYVNVMGQYRPLGRAVELRGIDRRPLPEEVAFVRRYATEKGLTLAT